MSVNRPVGFGSLLISDLTQTRRVFLCDLIRDPIRIEFKPKTRYKSRESQPFVKLITTVLS